MTRLDDNMSSAYISYDIDTRIMMLWNKGEASLNVFEYVPNSPSYIEYVHTFRHKEVTKGFDFLPKSVISTHDNELIRGVKLAEKSLSYYSFKNKIKAGFLEEFYPPYLSSEPANELAEWVKGTDKEPIRHKWDPKTALLNAVKER
jgi:hypothetical protein